MDHLSTGIGFESVKTLYKHGAKVYLAARNDQKAAEAIANIHEAGIGKGSVEHLKLDLSTIESAQKGNPSTIYLGSFAH